MYDSQIRREYSVTSDFQGSSDSSAAAGFQASAAARQLSRFTGWVGIGVTLAGLVGCGSPSSASAAADMNSGEVTQSNYEVKVDDTIGLLPPTASNGSMTSGSAQVCAADVIGARLSPVNLFLMVDRSGSMTQDSKWQQAVGALRSFLQDPESAGLRVALRFFSDDQPMVGCTMQGCSIDACSVPLVEAGELAPESGAGDAQESQLVGALEGTFPRSGLGTPIYPALGGALSWASSYRSEHPDEKAVVVFVTDGEPNGCNQDINDISGLAGSALSNFGIATYAIGLEGSNEAQMDQIGRAGGTGSGIFIGASTHAETELQQALDTIRGQTMSCDFALPAAPSGKTVDPSQVNVTLQNSSGAVDLFQVDSAAACSGQAAWYYDDAAAPSRIHLCPSACEVAGETSDISVEMGCVGTRRDPQLVR